MREERRSIVQQRVAAGGEIPIPMEIRPEHATPVYGSAQPTSGLPERLRRQAYSLPAHDPKHWLLLLAADRAETSASLARAALTPGQQPAVLRHFWRQARSYPKGYAVVAAATAGGLLLWARRRRRR